MTCDRVLSMSSFISAFTRKCFGLGSRTWVNRIFTLLPVFQTAYEKKYPPELTQEGKPRQRQIGGGATGALPKSEDKLFFILVYQKTNPLQTMHGLHFGLSKPQANDWIHRLLPVLQQA